MKENTFKKGLNAARKDLADAKQMAEVAAEEGEILHHNKDAFVLGVMTIRLADAYEKIAEDELTNKPIREEDR